MKLDLEALEALLTGPGPSCREALGDEWIAMKEVLPHLLAIAKAAYAWVDTPLGVPSDEALVRLHEAIDAARKGTP